MTGPMNHSHSKRTRPTAPDYLAAFCHEVQENDAVLVCDHLFKQPELFGSGPCAFDGRFSPPVEFTRDDGSKGACHFLLVCPDCSCLPNDQVSLVEAFWAERKLHVADFHRRPS